MKRHEYSVESLFATYVEIFDTFFELRYPNRTVRVVKELHIVKAWNEFLQIRGFSDVDGYTLSFLARAYLVWKPFDE